MNLRNRSEERPLEQLLVALRADRCHRVQVNLISVIMGGRFSTVAFGVTILAILLMFSLVFTRVSIYLQKAFPPGIALILALVVFGAGLYVVLKVFIQGLSIPPKDGKDSGGRTIM